MPIYEFEGVRPVVDPVAFVHPMATLIGDVIIGPRCLVGPGASLRGDLARLIMEEGANVQDNCTVHSFPGKDCLIGREAHVGHGAILHGCTLKPNAMVGMNTVVMDDAVVGEFSIIAASSFVKAGVEIPARSLAAGVPAKILRELSEKEMAWKSRGTAVYQYLAERYLETMKDVKPLREIEPDRKRVPEISHQQKHDQG